MSEKTNQPPGPGTIEGTQLRSFDPEVPVKPDNPDVNQGPEVSEVAFDGESEVNGGVGPQPDEHRGNAQGGFKYEGSEQKEEVREDDGSRAERKNQH